jgi:hypothetical protein
MPVSKKKKTISNSLKNRKRQTIYTRKNVNRILPYNKPVRTNRKNKKYMVRVWDPKTKRDKIVYFGHSKYEDYTQHHDKKRRESYLKRSAGIRNKNGKLTKDDPTSPNYWARRYLWASREKSFIKRPRKTRM